MKTELWRIIALAPFGIFIVSALIWSLYDLWATRKEEKALELTQSKG